MTLYDTILLIWIICGFLSCILSVIGKVYIIGEDYIVEDLYQLPVWFIFGPIVLVFQIVAFVICIISLIFDKYKVNNNTVIFKSKVPKSYDEN